MDTHVDPSGWSLGEAQIDRSVIPKTDALVLTILVTGTINSGVVGVAKG